MAETNVPELRELCGEWGVSRERGMNKADTAATAADQAPASVRVFVGDDPDAVVVEAVPDDAEPGEVAEAAAEAESASEWAFEPLDGEVEVRMWGLPVYTVISPDGFERQVDGEEEAVAVAREHHEEAGSEVKVWADDGRQIWGSDRGRL